MCSSQPPGGGVALYSAPLVAMRGRPSTLSTVHYGDSGGGRSQCAARTERGNGREPGAEHRVREFWRMNYQPVPSEEAAHGARRHSQEHSSTHAVKDFRLGNTQGCPELVCSWILIVLACIFMVLTFPVTGWFVLKSVPKYERFVVFRLGRILGSKGPGMILLLPFIDRWQKVDLRSKTFIIAPFEAKCKDGALITVGAEVQYRIWNPVLSVALVEDTDSTTAYIAQNVMRRLMHKETLAQIQDNKSKTGEELAFEVNRKAKHWGMEVQRVDLILHSVLNEPKEDQPDSQTPPPSSRLDKLPAPLRKLATQMLQSRRSPQPVQLSSHSSESEDSVRTSSEMSESEDLESDIVNPDWILSKVKAFLSEDLVKQIGARYLFTVNQKDGTQNLYFLDLSRDSGSAGYGMPEGDPDVTLEVTEDTMQALFSGDLKPFSAYMSGRIRIQGDLKLAMKLEDLIKKLNR
ncbi:stomatin-like protein 1 isoform X1 [Rhincodon typus]|uniref:stomatin-like protein 1 isoform X1 n=1 Tax=Rhincodon typus TaxID=259920 RepID=UPI00202F783C|nr:stomatin-like protein 1 isoform X1 [Rhincodon typus]